MAKTIAIKIDVQGTAEQQKKLAQLETEVKKLTNRRTQLNKAVKEGTISLAQYGKEIAEVNTRLKSNRREMLVMRENILGLDSFTKKLGKSFSKLGTSIGGAFVGLFAIQKVGQLFSQALSTIKEFEQQMAKVKAVSGATAQEFAALEKNAKDLGASTQFTATQVGQLQEEFAKLGFSTDQILDATEATLELAVATGSDLAQSAKVAAATINGFGMDAKDTQKIVDVMAKSFSSSALDLSKFETAMSAVAPVAATVGMSLEETTASLGVLVDAGFDASTAGTALRNILLDTQKAGISVSEAFDTIKGSTDPTSTALDLFGKRGAAVALALAKSTDKTADFTKELKNANGAASAMARIVGDTLEGDIKKFGSAWEGLVLNLGENGQDLFRDIVQGATDFIDTLGDLTKNIHAESDAMEDQRIKINVLVGRIQGLNEGTEERKKLINELNAISPDFLEGLDKENLSNEVLAKRLKEVNKELINQIIIKREQEKIQAQAESQADARVELIEKEIEIGERLEELRRGMSAENLAILDSEGTAIDKAGKLVAKRYNDQRILGNSLTKMYADYVKLQKQVREEDEIANDLIAEKNKLFESLGISQDEVNEKVEDNTKVVEDNNKAISKTNKEFEELGLTQEDIQKALTETLSEVTDEMDEIEIGFSNAYDAKKKEVEEFTDLYAEQAEAMGKIDDAANEKKVQDFVNNLNKKKELSKQEKEFQKQVNAELYDLGEQAANALVEVRNRKVEREKTLEIDALNAQVENGLITQEEFEKKREAIERKAFQKQKRLELAQVAISLAREIASINANAAANPLNTVTAGTAGLAQARILTGIAVARSAIQAGIIASQSFAEGGFTGSGFGSPDASGFKQAGVVHEGEYVVPKNVLETNRGSALVGALESMRLNRPQPYIGTGFANGGFTSMQSVDMVDMENRIARAVTKSMGAIQVVNNATDTISEAVKVSNIQSDATFG